MYLVKKNPKGLLFHGEGLVFLIPSCHMGVCWWRDQKFVAPTECSECNSSLLGLYFLHQLDLVKYFIFLSALIWFHTHQTTFWLFLDLPCTSFHGEWMPCSGVLHFLLISSYICECCSSLHHAFLFQSVQFSGFIIFRVVQLA